MLVIWVDFNIFSKDRTKEYVCNWHTICLNGTLPPDPEKVLLCRWSLRVSLCSIPMQQAGQIICHFAAGDTGLGGGHLPKMAQLAQQRWVVLVYTRHGDAEMFG